MEQSFIMVKPDGVQRNLVGDIVQRFENKGYTLAAAKLMSIPRETAEKHYAELKDKPFFNSLISFITSGPVFAMIWEGENVITEARKMMGTTNPLEAAPGTIRGDYAVQVGMNVIHGSDSPESAEREMNLFFSKDEIQSYEKNITDWV
ncbi:nucleoside-diphosphate kinase [Salibacterium halotolerans]|uniref:Nucleoside diphosphate kinase n=1 Tax=Salibacterium halotolerans TaxID=1884432 RepID=A0A1I5Q6Q0_9BACI|nr:nucleoside-diphosphate kinase [Salibacterium halotolerans]SFP41661.1 nucleoside-diphosphate kinase [Salibacterium halotolerans]